jgi:hypothetical protein
MLLIYSEGRANAVGRLREAIDKKEKGILFLFLRLRLCSIEVIDLNRD